MKALAEFDIEDLDVDITDDTVTLTGKGVNAEIVEQAHEKLQEMYKDESHQVICEVTYNEYDEEEEDEEEEDEDEEEEEEEDEDEEEDEEQEGGLLDEVIRAVRHLDFGDGGQICISGGDTIHIKGCSTADEIKEMVHIIKNFEGVNHVINDMEVIEE